jgi:hypothetical protein
MDALSLDGATLDCWVALAEGHAPPRILRVGRREVCHLVVDGAPTVAYEPSRDWGLAEPILARERIQLREVRARGEPAFEAMLTREGVTWFAVGPLPLVAAMRVLVRSRIPDALLDAARFDDRRPA